MPDAPRASIVSDAPVDVIDGTSPAASSPPPRRSLRRRRPSGRGARTRSGSRRCCLQTSIGWRACARQLLIDPFLAGIRAEAEISASPGLFPWYRGSWLRQVWYQRKSEARRRPARGSKLASAGTLPSLRRSTLESHRHPTRTLPERMRFAGWSRSDSGSRPKARPKAKTKNGAEIPNNALAN